MEINFKGKKCVITGAAKGIGKAVAMGYAANGADVAIVDIDEQHLLETYKELITCNTRVLPFLADVSSSTAVREVVDEITSNFPQIDILANCAGITNYPCEIVNLEEDIWDKVLNVNLKGVYMFSKYVAKHMIATGTKGKIISVSSMASKYGEHSNCAYCVSKAGVNMLTQVLSIELSKYGILVNSICPGYVNTELQKGVFERHAKKENCSVEEIINDAIKSIPVGRLGTPEEIADFILYLTSDKAGYFTGVSLTIAGGMALY